MTVSQTMSKAPWALVEVKVTFPLRWSSRIISASPFPKNRPCLWKCKKYVDVKMERVWKEKQPEKGRRYKVKEDREMTQLVACLYYRALAPTKKIFTLTTDYTWSNHHCWGFLFFPTFPNTREGKVSFDPTHVIRNLPQANWETLFHHHLGPEWRRSLWASDEKNGEERSYPRY